MSSTSDQSTQRPSSPATNEEEGAKRVEFYSAALTAWFGTAMEFDKSMFTLASAAIGLLMTLATTIGPQSTWEAALYCMSLLAFLTCACTVLVIFGRNKRHLMDLATKPDTTPNNDSVLDKLDGVALVSFVIGVAIAAVIGAQAVVSKMPRADAQKTSQPEQQQELPSAPEAPVNWSWTLRPDGGVILRQYRVGHDDGTIQLGSISGAGEARQGQGQGQGQGPKLPQDNQGPGQPGQPGQPPK